MVKKRFPTDLDLFQLTFLNDKKVDAELYAYLQSISWPEDGETRVYKDKLWSNTMICRLLGYTDRRTLKTHLQYLINTGFVIDHDNYYTLTDKESLYLLIPLETLKYMYDTLSQKVIKVYLYLGQRIRQEEMPVITYVDIAKAIGYSWNKHMRVYETINNVLDILVNRLKLIEIEWASDGRSFIVTKWSTELPKDYDGKVDGSWWQKW